MEAISLATLAGCVSSHDTLSHIAERDKAANLAIVAEMKSRTYEFSIKTLSNTASQILSNINKSAKLLKDEIGQIESVETGPTFHNNN